MNMRVITSERAKLCEETINAVRLVKDAIQCLPRGTATNIAISDKLLHSVKSAYIKYKQHMEEEKQLEDQRKHLN